MSGVAVRRRPEVPPDASAWGRVMKLTRGMLQGARDGRWEQVGTLQDERFGLIRQFFAADPPPAELERIRPQVSALLDMDEQVAALGRRERARLGDDLQQIRRGRAGRKAYGGV
jgi:hypothetical protein